MLTHSYAVGQPKLSQVERAALREKLRKIKIMKIKASWGPLKSLGAPGKCPLPPPPLSQWACEWVV